MVSRYQKNNVFNGSELKPLPIPNFEKSRYLHFFLIFEMFFSLIHLHSESKIFGPFINLSIIQSCLLNQLLNILSSEQTFRDPLEHNGLQRGDMFILKARHVWVCL